MEATTARLWNAQQAAEYLGVRTSWVREAARGRRLPHIKVGRHVRFLRGDLETWITTQRVDALP